MQALSAAWAGFRADAAILAIGITITLFLAADLVRTLFIATFE